MALFASDSHVSLEFRYSPLLSTVRANPSVRTTVYIVCIGSNLLLLILLEFSDTIPTSTVKKKLYFRTNISRKIELIWSNQEVSQIENQKVKRI